MAIFHSYVSLPEGNIFGIPVPTCSNHPVIPAAHIIDIPSHTKKLGTLSCHRHFRLPKKHAEKKPTGKLWVNANLISSIY